MTPAAARANRARGESLEQMLDAYHRTLAAQGRAWVRRVGTPVKVLGKVSRDARGRSCFRAAFDGHQGADFVGFDHMGRHICLEAKVHSGAGAWDCGVSPDGGSGASGALDGSQWLELVFSESAGATALVILHAWGGWWAIRPCQILKHVSLIGRRTVRPTEIETIGRRLVGVQWMDE